MVTISVCMIVKNEEAVLARCLDSIRGIADEIIIVDTGSTDKTKEIASNYTKHIYDFTWVNDFSVARNFAFSKATKDYIYSADADEVLEEIKSISKKVYEIFHLNGIIRIDFIYTNKKLYVNEINTIPGSYAYYLWEEDNLLSLLEECIKEGVSMYQKKMTQITSFDSDVLFQYKMGNKCK